MNNIVINSPTGGISSNSRVSKFDAYDADEDDGERIGYPAITLMFLNVHNSQRIKNYKKYLKVKSVAPWSGQ